MEWINIIFREYLNYTLNYKNHITQFLKIVNTIQSSRNPGYPPCQNRMWDKASSEAVDSKMLVQHWVLRKIIFLLKPNLFISGKKLWISFRILWKIYTKHIRWIISGNRIFKVLPAFFILGAILQWSICTTHFSKSII